MEETFEQKITRNVQGQFAVYKAIELVGGNSGMPNLEWEEQDAIDKFFAFAKNLGVKVIYIAEGEETDTETGESKSTIVQVGFLYQGVMHHIDYSDDDEEDDVYAEDDEEAYEQDEAEDGAVDDSEKEYADEGGGGHDAGSEYDEGNPPQDTDNTLQSSDSAPDNEGSPDSSRTPDQDFGMNRQF